MVVVYTKFSSDEKRSRIFGNTSLWPYELVDPYGDRH